MKIETVIHNVVSIACERNGVVNTDTTWTEITIRTENDDVVKLTAFNRSPHALATITMAVDEVTP
jgi:hypothetical protein